jgi:hypothetical protein
MHIDTVFLYLKIYGITHEAHFVGSRNLSLNNIVTKPLHILQYKKGTVSRD